ncbi:hypothetical protein EB809_00935 [Marinobacter sp. R17]|uniref:hypothetical protein n=1 Tax=Marinobacter sp. R17 TaxID=2484250 RepID=UPI000F4BF1D6|nr:hypothetical protein [Marinobacter sp. R17]ROU02099.1 hypothetical protein EB809_00935 [Marinobacter sp. R17]
MERLITSDNAEAIGRPIIEQIITAHLNSDYDHLLAQVPTIRGKVPQEEFEEAAANLEPFGNVRSIEYLGHFAKVKEHLVLWRVRYERADEDILWHLYLSDLESEVQTVGLFFDL